MAQRRQPLPPPQPVPPDRDTSVRERAEADARRTGLSPQVQSPAPNTSSEEVAYVRRRLDLITRQIEQLSHSLSHHDAFHDDAQRSLSGGVRTRATTDAIDTQSAIIAAYASMHGSEVETRAVADQPDSLGSLLAELDEAQVPKESERLRDIADLLGGQKVVGKYPANSLAAHEMLERGLPNTAIKHLLEGMTTLAQKSVESAIGMSVRTRQRREKHPTELLSPDQTARTWKLAEILTRATSVFGSRTAAEQWLAQPSTGLDRRRPIDLLTTPAGVELLEDYLGRVEYGVYT